ncbi:hypothetical protein F5B22DRAFT_377160 [Xylaria bambusicola]|uniref:uncharacterized protein n=1 Tax=Xylaria bambusicola TaxID=326684 RepID=UPI00200787C6|nr:uncharacterized protein F5B22DRAFT_377160 [Xylaria bambusicola]KAI0508841.1 hypothetical protein F5B22DRAFT_377160 [Xylaria bambusicola]
MNTTGLPHDSRGNVVIIAGVVTNSLAALAVCARIYTRHVIKRSLGVDDWMAVLSLLLTIGMNVSQSISATRYLGRHTYDLDPLVDIPRFLQVISSLSIFLSLHFPVSLSVNINTRDVKLFWINELLYNAAMLFIKMTFLTQYYRVFRHVNTLKTTYLAAIIIIGGWCTAQFLSVIFICVPVQGLWDKSVKAKCQNQLIGVYLNAVGTLVTDIAILVLPIPAIWGLNLPKTQKWALIGIFSIGIFTSAISIVRLTTLNSPNDDLTYNAVTSSCWSVAELSSGIIAAALATTRPLVSSFVPSFASKLNSALKHSRHYGDGTPTKGSGRCVRIVTALGRFSRGTTRSMVSICDTDLFGHSGFTQQESQAQGEAPGVARGQSLDTLNTWTRKSESFNVARGDGDPTSGPIERSGSQRSSRYCYYESSSRDSEADLGLWPSTQTKVTGGLPPLPQLHTEEIETAKPQALTIRVDRDWEVQETFV